LHFVIGEDAVAVPLERQQIDDLVITLLLDAAVVDGFVDWL
jgi:hypothetical protein